MRIDGIIGSPLRTPLLVSLCLCLIGVESGSTSAQDRSQDGQQQSEAATVRQQFRFERAPWRSVLEWLADWADLELHVDTLPTGSFTYSGKRFYTADEAINRINLFLIPQRYSLVRSHNLLSVISLDDQRSIRQLDAMAVTVRPDELQSLGSQELVKCLISLGNSEPERVLQELGGLMLIREPVVLRNTNQLLVTDTAGKLRMVQEIIDSMSSPDPSIGPVKRFPLGNLDPERVLTQIRPHVGLDPLATIGADIRISIDPVGNQLLASGSNENLDAIAGVFMMLEETSQVATLQEEPKDFRPHHLGAADMQTVVGVLHTLLVDEDVRMTPDVSSNLIAILGTEEVHQLVETTITELTGINAVEFRAIPVHTVAPRYAAMVLSEMFSQPADEPGGPGTPSASDTPKIEADSINNRLFVRARPEEMAAIERALEELGESDVIQPTGLRLLPYHGERGRRLLESAREFWPHNDELLILPSSDEVRTQPIEREINPDPQRVDVPIQPHNVLEPGSTDRVDRSTSPEKLVAMSHVAVLDDELYENSLPQVRVQLTPRGLLIQSDDPEALRRFEKHIQLIAGSAGSSAQQLAVFHLKHAVVDDANRLLQSVLDAEAYSKSFANSQGSLTSGGGRLDSALRTFGIEASTIGNRWTAGTTTVIPDKRLNRLFAYGTASDLANIERHLEIIDRESSIATVKTHGTTHVIPLQHARAQDVADILRDTYAGLISAPSKEIQDAQQAQNQNENQQGNRQNQGQRDNQTPPQQPQPAAVDSQQLQIKLAVDSPSNTLIVTAPKQLATEVRELALTIDEQSAQTVKLIPIHSSSSVQIQNTLQNLFGERLRSKIGNPDNRTP